MFKQLNDGDTFELDWHKKSTELLKEIEAYLSFNIMPCIDNMRKMKESIENHLNKQED